MLTPAFIRGICMIAVSLMAIGCLGEPEDRDIQLRKVLVGKWYVETGSRRTEVSNNKDGTCSSRTTVDGKFAWSTSGEWWVKAGRLEGVYRKASLPDFPIGEVDSSELMEATLEFYVIKNRNGVTKKYLKLK